MLRGPHGSRMGGAVRQQVCDTCQARLRRLQVAWVLGQRREVPAGGRPPWDFRELFPDLVLEHLQEAARHILHSPKSAWSPALLGACLSTDALGASRPVWVPDTRWFFSGVTPPAPAARAAHLPLDPPPLGPGSSPDPLRAPQRRLPAPRPRSPRSPQTAPHPPRGRLPASAPPGRTPPGPRYLGLSKLHPLRRSAALFCRRSAAATPPGSGSIAPGGGRGLGRTRVGSGLGGARPAARLARRSLCPAPRATAGPRPRPSPTPNFSPGHSLPRSWVQTPPHPRPELQPHPPRAPQPGPGPAPPPPRTSTQPSPRSSAGSRSRPSPKLQPRPSHAGPTRFGVGSPHLCRA